MQRSRRGLCIIFNRVKSTLVYAKFILVWLRRKLLAYINTLESVLGTNQYWAISVKFLAQGNNSLSLIGFEPMRLAILRLLVRRTKLMSRVLQNAYIFYFNTIIIYLQLQTISYIHPAWSSSFQQLPSAVSLVPVHPSINTVIMISIKLIYTEVFTLLRLNIK